MYEGLFYFSKLLFNTLLLYFSFFVLCLGGGKYLLAGKGFQCARTGVQRGEWYILLLELMYSVCISVFFRICEMSSHVCVLLSFVR